MVGLPWCMPRSTSELELEVLSMLRKNMLVILSGWKRYNFPRIPFRSKGFQHALILSRRREPTARLISHKHSPLPLSARYASSARRLSRQEAPLHAARPCPWRGRDGGGCTGSDEACRCWRRWLPAPRLQRLRLPVLQPRPPPRVRRVRPSWC